MSILPFERLFDNAEIIERRTRDEKQDRAGTRKVDEDPPPLRCRVCGYISATDEHCPICVAFTMVKADRP